MADETPLDREQFQAAIQALPGILSGRLPDPRGIALAFRLRVAVAFLEKVKEAYIVKSRGGTGEDGISWPPLTPQYLAYGRGPFSTRRAGRRAPGTVQGGPRDGQPKDGFMSPSDLKRWRQVYGQVFARLAQQVPLPEARARAAKIAWAMAKKAGVRTKLDVFGSREVDVLRDRGILFNSLSPGVIVPAGSTLAYDAPPGQVLEQSPGQTRVGTNVAYAGAHHRGKNPRRLRRLWPDSLPDSWAAYCARHGRDALIPAIRLLLEQGLMP